jgi:bacillithiol biosynthesis cysteine-adding enzyme BshC
MKCLTRDETIGPTLHDETVSGDPALKARSLPFSQVPHTTKLFLDFLGHAPAAREFYPRPPRFGEWLKAEASAVRYDAARRAQVCAILDRQNKSWDASQQTLANLDRLRKGAVAVVTGQQVGLFGGPAFCIYKALTAVKLAQQATAAGVETVPVFWLATYDHDLAEVNHVSLPGPDGGLQTLTASSHGIAGAPVSTVRFGDEILPLVEQAAALLGENQATQWLRESYRPGETLGTAFARLYTRMFAEWGVIVLDASDPELHRVALPVYQSAIERADELDAALLTRGQALEAAGYHQQVKVTASSVLVFAMKDGARTAVHRRSVAGTQEFIVGDASGNGLSSAELTAQISAEPERFSPNVLLRPVVQDYLLPTLAYVGGAAEVAYFAQAGAIFEKLAGRVTPVLPRFSATVIESKTQRVMEKKSVSLPDAFGGPEALRRQLAARSLPSDLLAAFDAASKSLSTHMAVLQEKIAVLDQTLVDAVQTAASKTQYQLEKLQAQAARAEALKSELIGRYAESLSQALYPNKGLQERSVAAIYFVARYGPELLRQIHDAIPPDCNDHQILEL